MRGVIACFLVVSTVGWLAMAGPADEVPAPFLPFEHMIGGWKGTAKPASNPLKGWAESHGWAWKFEKGKPVGLSLTFEGGKTIAKGQVSYDELAKKYKLDGTDPQGKPIAFIGSFSPDGKTLTFDRVGNAPEGKERVIVRPNSNKIRYTLQIDRQEPGAPQYKNVITVGLTKDGEAFAAGSGGADLPKCIMTGGAASLTVSYQGKSYPVCCTGCRDEFNDNPEKYAKKAELAAKSSAGKDSSAAKPAAKGKDDGSFDGLIDEPKSKTNPMPSAKTVPAPKAKAEPVGEPAAEAKTAKTKDDSEAKAARDVQLGQNFEKQGKNAVALDYYRKVVKDHPKSEAAKTAAARIKALEGK
jgi:YHS domain-containing protein